MVGGGISSSVMRNSQASAFPRDGDRFKVNKFTLQTPSPDRYHIKNGLNQNFSSTHSFAGQTVFGSNKKTYIDRDWRLGEEVIKPGPGAYQTFSDFGGFQ